MKEISLTEWTAEAIRRFGNDRMKWRFVCPICGHTQCAEDFINTTVKDPKNTVYQECIGRYNGKAGGGCGYAACGLISSDIVVTTVDGHKVHVFPFAEVDS